MANESRVGWVNGRLLLAKRYVFLSGYKPLQACKKYVVADMYLIEFVIM